MKHADKFLAAIGWLLFLLTVGFVGGVECETLPVTRGFLLAWASLAGSALCLHLAGKLWRG